MSFHKNGWFRLWVVASGITAIVLTMKVSASRFSEQEAWVMQRQNEITLTLSVTEEANRAMAGAPAGPSRDAIESRYQDILEREIAKAKESVESLKRSDEEQMPRRYWEAIRVWAFLTFGAYAIGWIMVWVFRGFRPKRDNHS